MTAGNRLEESYLKHILTAVEVRDSSAPFRTFLDNWYAFREGGPFLNRRSRPHWFNNPCPDRHGQALGLAHFISIDAARTLGGLERSRLIKDHAIPVAVLRDMLFDEQPESINEVRAFLIRHYRFGIITSDEDAKLTSAGLRSRMPAGWSTADGPFARYEMVGIIAQDRGSDVRVASLPSLPSTAPRRPVCRLAGLLNSTTSQRAWEGSTRDA
jgi:hypothetical protein